MKICKKCNISLEENNFHKQVRRSDGLYPWCKVCVKKYNTDNREAKNLRLKNWRLKNPEKNKLLDKLSKQRRKEKIRAEQRIWQKRTRLLNPNFRLAQNLRTRLNMAIRYDTKVGSAVTDLGCSIDEFKLYLETKFQPGMNWDNWSKDGWHIDHIKPLSSFDLSDLEQFKEATHYSNMQPLWAVDNLKKGTYYE